LKDRVSDSVKKMCLAESYSTVDEEWVVALTRLLSYSHRGGVTELIAVTDHEILEGVARINIVKNLSLNGSLPWYPRRLSGLLILWSRLLYRSRTNSLNDERRRGATEA
jgi:hypothetical protein